MPHPGPKGRCSVNIPQLILSIVDVAAAIFLIAVVLLQSGKSAGLSGAIAGGVERVHILDGRIPHSILIELLSDEGIGTMLKKED